ncbi:MAG: DUF3575 domain-containing protein [Bacteroidales bacterium]|nr:DUF3575 domain-containing protein [Bacteroidales bacterium]
MKKTLVLLLACLMAVNVSAQKAKSSTSKKATTTKTTSAKKSTSKKNSDVSITKGTIFFNTNATNISFNNISFGAKDGSETQSLTRFGLLGTGGYGIIDNLALVGGVGFQYGKVDDSSLTAFTLNAGARYYIIHSLYASGMFVLGTTNINNNTEEGPTGKGSTFGFDIGVGYSWFLTPRIALEPNLSYSIGLSNKMANEEFKLNSLTFNIGFTILL